MSDKRSVNWSPRLIADNPRSAIAGIPEVTQRKGLRQYRPRKGRPTSAQIAAIDRAILAAAIQRFLADGYAGASMDAIITAAGVSSGTLYSRYRDKKSLFRAVVKYRADTWTAEVAKQNWQLGDTLEKRLKQYAKILMTLGATTEAQGLRRLFDAASDQDPEMARTLYEKGYKLIIKRMAREIRDFTRADRKESAVRC
jgi:TetR/AcrR family transcriptional regulator, mexJK operon transcriptional repressor